MRIGHLQPTRPEWYDRRPATHQLILNQTITGSQNLTTQVSYTIPSGQKAYIDSAMLSVVRTTDATPNALVLLQLEYENADGPGPMLEVRSSVSTYGAVGDQWLGQGGIVVAGEILRLKTSSQFPDGTVTLRAGVKLTTFDA